ncbi:MAG: class I SAM-dependent methyltransferase [Rhodospirillales bacterium]|nr:class I SAM-dependent methyltransferase [Rhodospirillales bacterium]
MNKPDNDPTENNGHIARHLRITAPSSWVTRFAPLVRDGGSVLDLAAGGGRHGRYFRDRGHPVTFVDRDAGPLIDLAGERHAEVIAIDLENGGSWPLPGRTFDAIVVTNYLHRPLFPAIIGALAEGGVLIYETFARGNEEYSRPRNPDHLLKAGELIDIARGRLQVVAYEHGIKSETPLPGVVQRICAINDLSRSARGDNEPPPHPLKAVP